VLLFSAFLAILLALYIFAHPGKRRFAARLLGTFLVVQALGLIVSLILYGGGMYLWSNSTNVMVFNAENALILAEAFLLYWYCRVLLLTDHLSWKEGLVHLAGLLFIWFLSCYAYSGANMIQQFNALSTDRSSLVGFTYFGVHVLRCAYFFLAYQVLRRYLAQSKLQLSAMFVPEQRWLLMMLLGLFFVRGGWCLMNLQFALNSTDFWPLDNNPYVLGTIGALLDITWLAVHIGLLYFGLRFSAGFTVLEDLSRKKSIPWDERQLSQLQACMANKKPYQEAALKLDELAAMLSMPAKTLSTLINQHYQENFSDFINRHRVEEAKRLLRDPEWHSKTVLDVAIEAGFNSKSSFNRAFKRFCEHTPLSYRRQSS
jgi:AraC-like DNA-binding protein